MKMVERTLNLISRSEVHRTLLLLEPFHSRAVKRHRLGTGFAIYW